MILFQSLTYKQKKTVTDLKMSDNEENDDGESVATNTTTNTTATFSLEDIRDLLNQPNALQQLLQNATAGASNPSQDLLNRITSLEQQRGAIVKKL